MIDGPRRPPPPPPPPPKPKVKPEIHRPAVKAPTSAPTRADTPTAKPANQVKGFSGRSSFEPTRRPLVELNPTAAPLRSEAKPKTTREQADELHKEIEKSVQKPPAEWNATDAARYTEELAKQVEANKDDPELVRSLMTRSSSQLQRSAEIIGHATEENDFNGDDVEKLAANLSRIGNAAPEDAAAKLAYGVANAIPEDSEQNRVDDGFGHFIDNGGDSRFRDLVAGALQSQGKGEAAEELVETSGGSSLTDRLGDAFEAIGDVGGFFTDLGKQGVDAAFDFGGDVVGAVVDGGKRIIGAAGDFALDAAKGTLEFAGDVADLTTEAVQEGIKFAVEKGLQLAGPLVEKARDFIQDKVLDTLNIDEKINTLKPGDSLSIGGSVNVTAGIDVGVEADLQVTANEDGSYTVSGEVGGDLGVKLLGGGTIGAGGKVEFTFANKEEATKAAESLALTGAAAAAAVTPPFQAAAPLLIPGGSDFERLANNISAIEVSAEASASLDDALKLGDTSPFSAGVEAGVSYRVEIENGKPVALTREQSLSGNVSADLASEAFKGANGLTGNLNLAEASASANVTVSTRIPLPGDLNVGDILQTGAFAADFTGSVSNLLPNAETSIKGSLDVSAGGNPKVGAEVAFEVPDVEITDGLRIAGELVQGNLSGALRNVPDVTLSGNTYTEDGFLVDGGIEVLGQGIDINLHNTVKHVGEDFEVTLFDE